MSTARAARRSLVGSIKEGAKDVPIIGFWTYWSVRNVDITQEDFKKLLVANGLNEKYAREHNYRSAFARALKNMEEKRIIRKVEETDNRMVIQFTAEEVVKSEGDKELSYEKETILIVDKKKYYETQKFEDALTSEGGRPEIRRKVLNYFKEEKVKYNSGDITRYVQNILAEGGDVISLRDQGCLYFVPAGSQELLDKVVSLVRSLSDSSMEAVPLPDVEASRKLVGNAFVDELDQTLTRWENELEAVEAGDKAVGEKWGQTKMTKISELVLRMKSYSSLIGATDTERLEMSFKALEERVSPKRKLMLDAVVEQAVEKAEEAKVEEVKANEAEPVGK